LKYTDFLLAASEQRLSNLAGNRWRFGCANLYVEQELMPRARKKKEPERFCPVGARCGAYPL